MTTQTYSPNILESRIAMLQKHLQTLPERSPAYKLVHRELKGIKRAVEYMHQENSRYGISFSNLGYSMQLEHLLANLMEEKL